MCKALLSSLFVARTNIDIDDELLGRVMRHYGHRTKREAVDYALRRIDVKPLSHEAILELEGMGWDGDLDQMRRNGPHLDAWLNRE